jgi:hypothetical protein
MTDLVDPRNIRSGLEIPSETYSDQPYVVRTDDDAWLCVLTTGSGREGETGQHVVTTRSADRGRTWSKPVSLEPGDARENSYAVLLKVPSGRVFCVYNHNTDNLRAVRADDPPYSGGLCRRVDSLGYYVLKYSDDHGRTWSTTRTVIPVREMEIDRQNAYAGDVRFFWNVGRPFLMDGVAFVSLHKVGGFGGGFFTRSEGVLLRSADLALVRDPADATWVTLPEGDHGISTPPGGGPIAEEHSYSVLSDGSLFVVYRTVDGHPACSYSRDGGRTWTVPEYQRYADGRLMKHPRAANFAWRCTNGRYLYWFHNHGGRFVREMADPMMPYADRNPVWLCGGAEVSTPEGAVIRWSQPEIVLYDDDPYVRMSYPDLVEEPGRYFLTETQKDKARVHEVASDLIDGLWSQGERATVVTEGLLLRLPEPGRTVPAQVAMPRLQPFLERDPDRSDYGTRDLRTGFSLDLWMTLDSLAAGQTVLDARTPGGRGLCLRTTSRGTLEISLNDGRTECRWDCDPGVLVARQRHHVVVNVDGGPKVISFVVDGRLCDGADFRQFGWGRYSPHLRHANGSDALRLATAPSCQIDSLRIYARCLRTSEAVSNFRAGCNPRPA